MKFSPLTVSLSLSLLLLVVPVKATNEVNKERVAGHSNNDTRKSNQASAGT